MTIRDKVREIYPWAIDEQYQGGVKGCPCDFPELEHYCPHGGEGCSPDDDCEACWSQEYREEPAPKPVSAPEPGLQESVTLTPEEAEALLGLLTDVLPEYIEEKVANMDSLKVHTLTGIYQKCL